MNETGLLAHLRDQFRVPPENLATETLAYILNSSDRARNAMVRLARLAQPDLPGVLRFETQYMAGEDVGIPDLIGLATGGGRPLFGEVKFDAGLTSNQPVSYLRELLRAELPGLLLFIVPERRVSMVWAEVRRRCNTEELELTSDLPNSAPLTVAAMNQVRVGIISWAEVLNSLEDSLRGDSDRQSLYDLRQLRAMCERLDREAFVPFDSRDLDGRSGRRLEQFIRLVYELTEDVLFADGTVRLDGLSRTASGAYIGRYVSIAGWQCLLQVNWGLWASRRNTPIWLELNDWKARGYTPLSEELAPLLTDDPPRMLIADGWKRLIPIYLKEGASRDEVREDMANQIRSVAVFLQRVPKPMEE
jgi:hypothetical protein